jgi:hypothetical protein
VEARRAQRTATGRFDRFVLVLSGSRQRADIHAAVTAHGYVLK